MKSVLVVDPSPDGSCVCVEVRTADDGTFSVTEPVVHWTAMVLFDKAWDVHGEEDVASEALSSAILVSESPRDPSRGLKFGPGNGGNSGIAT